MFELLRGNEITSQFYAFNSISIPNSSGHWILLVLLQIFSAFTATKIMVTLTFALFVLGAAWLRIQTVGFDGVKTSMLIGAAMGFNWLWLVGFYNFTIGTVAFLFTLGLFYRRREKLGVTDAIVLSLLLLFTYFSHIVGFLILFGSIFILLLFVSRQNRIKTFLLTFAALLPVIPLAVMFRNLSESSEGFAPVWRSLNDPYSISSWIYQIRVVDPFIIISRKAFPFVSGYSNFYAIFTPSLWLLIAFLCLAAASYFYYRSEPQSLKPYYPFVVLVAGSLGLALFGPDDFQQTNGGVLRERWFIAGMLLFIPIFRIGMSAMLKRAAQLCLVFVIAFQTLAVWDYATTSSSQAAEFLTAAPYLQNSPSSVTVTFDDESLRFHAHTVPQLNCYNGIGHDNIIWDNYEFGHYLFPVVTKSTADRHFIHTITRGDFYALDDPNDGFEIRLDRLRSSLEEYNERVDTLAVWGTEPTVEAVLQKWFEPVPYFQNGRVRLFRHK